MNKKLAMQRLCAIIAGQNHDGKQAADHRGAARRLVQRTLDAEKL
jgi:hypothetical protein